MADQTPEDFLLKAHEIEKAQERGITHPLNPNSEVYLRPLSERTGLKRAILTLARVPPGKESFAYHTHLGDEEFLYILSGRGRALIGDKVFEVGPGDFMGFPTPSPGHHLINPYEEDLVYLMGGERGRLEVVEFARHGKHLIFAGDNVHMVDSSALKSMSWSDWLRK